MFLDSNTLQAISDYGGAVFENEEFDSRGRSGASREDVEALRGIFLVAQRASFEFVVSNQSKLEAAASPDASHLLYVYEVAAHWADCVSENPSPFDGRSATALARLDAGLCGYLSSADKCLIQDAVAYECDTFLTIERRLVTNSEHLSRTLELEVVRPPELWDYFQPHLSAL